MSHLVLSRKLDEKITIRDVERPDGEPIVLTVERIKGGTVRLGLEAEKRYRIVRNELVPSEGGQQS